MSQSIYRLLSILLLCSLFISEAFSQSTDSIEFVESVPLETTLGVEGTSRTEPVWLEMIGSAKKSIDMEIFYLSAQPGEPFDSVLQELKSAAKRGVRIRIITDAKMFKIYPQPLMDLNDIQEIEVRKLSYFNGQGGVLHAKYFVVDKEQVFIGSQNMDWRALTHIHELGVRIRNVKFAGLLSDLFKYDWILADENRRETTLSDNQIPESNLINSRKPLMFEDNRFGSILLFPVFSPRDALLQGMDWDEQKIIDLIDNAKQNIAIQLLSYSPVSHRRYYAKLENALRQAATRGVSVQMIVSNWNAAPPRIQYLKSLQALPGIEIRISSIPPYSGGFIPYARVEHCKYMAVDDDKIWLGTGNWSYDYFYNSRNVGVLIQNPGINQLIRSIFMKSWDSQYCQTVDLCREYQAPRVSGK